MLEAGPQWQRPNFRPGGGDPFLFYVIYGATDVKFEVQALTYRTHGLPKGVEARAFKRSEHFEYLRTSYEEGQPWDQLVERAPSLADTVRQSVGAIVFAGAVKDPSSLEYLRTTIGMAAWLLDHGGAALYDPFTFQWWHPNAWKERFFIPDTPNPNRHVMIYFSQDDEDRGLWFHTRGMIKFGRPDLSFAHADRYGRDAMVSLLNQLIEYQALGGVIAEGQRIKHPELDVFVASIQGDEDDPEFNNVHVELTPTGA